MATLTIHYDSDYQRDGCDIVGVFGGVLDNKALGEYACYGNDINELLGIENWKHLFADDVRQMLEACPEVVAFSPVYAYIHSGTTIATTPFYCPWDSGQTGWAVVTKSMLEIAGLTDFTKEQAMAAIEDHIKELDAVIQGHVFGFTVTNEDGEYVDGCWGFVGSDVENNGMLEYLDESLHEEARAAFDTWDIAA